ncbi:hypothetical protein ACFONG_12425 [Uliginosibacterium paludis]|uniref:Uncharacterized protein n=1 Tax=Uliginosibacterium paludis TaxID=1615952 RepID=A0ABV2CQB1_9RHOO
MTHSPPRPESTPRPGRQHDTGKPPASEDPIDLATESVAGEEDPGAALAPEPVGTPAPAKPA